MGSKRGEGGKTAKLPAPLRPHRTTLLMPRLRPCAASPCETARDRSDWEQTAPAPFTRRWDVMSSEPVSGDLFGELEATAREASRGALLDALAESLRQEGRWHDWFEVLKMRLRHRLGLPLLYDDTADPLEESVREELERGLLDACRQVGVALFESGRPSEGWLYLRALGEPALAAELLRKVPVTDERTDELIQVAVYEGVDLEYGFALLLKQYGICNAITTFDQVMHDRPRSQRKGAARLLLDHLYRELVENVAYDRSQREGTEPGTQNLAELIAGHDELFEENAYHIDTSHLAAVVRFARDLEDQEGWRLAWELSIYGEHLADLYQMPDLSPFESFYEAHRHFFAVLLEQNADEVTAGLEFFRAEADRVLAGGEDAPDPSMAREVYLDLLLRTGRRAEAVREAVRLYPNELPRELAANLLEAAATSGTIEPLMEHARRRGDLLTFGTLLALQPQG